MPKEKPNLIKISLEELINSGRIHEGKHDQSAAMKQLSRYSSRLEFYVNEETNSSFPLKLALIDGQYLAPNIPVSRIDFQGEISFGVDSVILNFPFGVNYTIINEKERWESESGQSESGWGDIQTALPSKSYTKRTHYKKSLKINSSVEYKLE